MDKPVYVCAGTCGAVIDEERYNAGLTKCGAEDCTHYGQPFEKRMECGTCKKIYAEEQIHSH